MQGIASGLGDCRFSERFLRSVTDQASSRRRFFLALPIISAAVARIFFVTVLPPNILAISASRPSPCNS
jgi:hypothetical protein